MKKIAFGWYLRRDCVVKLKQIVDGFYRLWLSFERERETHNKHITLITFAIITVNSHLCHHHHIFLQKKIRKIGKKVLIKIEKTSVEVSLIENIYKLS